MLTLCLLLAAAQSPDAEFRTFLDSLADKPFRGIVYIEQAGKEKFFHSVGFADPATKKPFTRETGLCIGSIVKPFSRVALFKLAQQGKLSFDDSISKYFDNVPEDKKAITLRMLASHRAGFQDIFGDDYAPMQRDELMQKMLASKLIFKPDEKDEYSNAGFSMIATVIEKVTGESFEQAVNRLEFKPLGMTKTGYVIPKWKKNDLAVGSTKLGVIWGTPLDHFWYKDGPSWNLRGNGGMLSTAPELARWARGAHTGEMLTPEDYEIFMPSFANGKDKDRYTISAGGNGIFNTIMLYNPHRKIAVIAASMDGRFEIESVVRDLAKLSTKVCDPVTPG